MTSDNPCLSRCGRYQCNLSLFNVPACTRSLFETHVRKYNEIKKSLQTKSFFVFIKDVQEIISKSVVPKIVNEDNTIATAHLEVEQSDTGVENADCGNHGGSNIESTSCQTLALEYFGKSKHTQTKKSMMITTSKKCTQTILTIDSLLKLVFSNAVSTGSQTDPCDNIGQHLDDPLKTIECETSENAVELQDVDSSKVLEYYKPDANVEITEPSTEELCESVCGESCSDSYGMDFEILSADDSQSEEENDINKESEQDEERIPLSPDKSIENQLKFIICEESIAHIFGICQKCGSSCSVSIRNMIGSYCVIYIYHVQGTETMICLGQLALL